MTEATTELSEVLKQQVEAASILAVDHCLAAVLLDRARPAPMSRVDAREFIRLTALEAVGPLLAIRCSGLTPEEALEVVGRSTFTMLATILERALVGLDFVAGSAPAEPR